MLGKLLFMGRRGIRVTGGSEDLIKDQANNLWRYVGALSFWHDEDPGERRPLAGQVGLTVSFATGIWCRVFRTDVISSHVKWRWDLQISIPTRFFTSNPCTSRTTRKQNRTMGSYLKRGKRDEQSTSDGLSVHHIVWAIFRSGASITCIGSFRSPSQRLVYSPENWSYQQHTKGVGATGRKISHSLSSPLVWRSCHHDFTQ